MKRIISLILTVTIVLGCCVNVSAAHTDLWKDIKPSDCQVFLSPLYRLENILRDAFFIKQLRAERIDMSLERPVFAQKKDIKKFVSVNVGLDFSKYKHSHELDDSYILQIYKYNDSRLRPSSEMQLVGETTSASDKIVLSKPGNYVLMAQSMDRPSLKAYEKFKIAENDILYQKGDPELLVGSYCDYTANGGIYKTSKTTRYILTPMIPVNENDRFTFNYVHSVVLFDSDRNFITGFSYKDLPESTGNFRINDYVIPEGVSYIRVNFANDYDLYALCKITDSPYEIVVLGDSIFGMEEKPNDIPSSVQYQTGIKIANCAIGGSTASDSSGVYKLLEFVNIADAIYNGDFTETEAAAKAALSAGSANNRVVHNALLLKTVDFSKVKTLIIAYGTNDWNFGVSAEVYEDSLNYGINRILSKYPNIQIVLCTPIYRGIASSPNSNNVYLSDFAEIVQKVADENGYICFNHYDNSGIDETNYAEYLKDGTHPNKAGIELLADVLTTELLSLYF